VGESGPNAVVSLLTRVSRGDDQAPEALFQLLYGELRAFAQALFGGSAETLQPTALVHEAYLKLVGAGSLTIKDREHFFSLAARAMRQVLIDHARAKARDKRGGGRQRITLSSVETPQPGPAVDLLGLDEALAALAEQSPRRARVVELHIFGGLTLAQIGEMLGVSRTTITDDWAFAKAWLSRRLRSLESAAGPREAGTA
jgi:RNA polymerase sigma-70 factor, ECF subfamily